LDCGRACPNREFSKLVVKITPQQATKLAEEACGSPQLMPRICLDVCFNLGLGQEQSVPRPMELERTRLIAILEQSSTHADFGTMVANMNQGPKMRGTERRIHKLVDGSEGDVYRVLLLAMAHGDAAMSLPYGALMERIEDIWVTCLRPAVSYKRADNSVRSQTVSPHRNGYWSGMTRNSLGRRAWSIHIFCSICGVRVSWNGLEPLCRAVRARSDRAPCPFRRFHHEVYP
jgi:hypothetical protein